MKPILLNKETNEIQRIVALRHSRNKRFHHQEFIIEGTLNINQALKTQWPIKSIYYNKDCALSKWSQKILADNSDSIIYSVSKPMMDKISDRDDYPELLMIGKSQTKHFSDYVPKANDVVVVLDQPKSAGNLGMIIRSAAAFGVNAIVISGHAADEYDPQCIRSSVGSFFSLPIYRIEGIDNFTKKICEVKSRYKLEIIASGNKGNISLAENKFTKDLLFVVFGNETQGVSEGYRNISDKFLHIPLSGDLTSLNIGAAASIFLYEIMGQRKVFPTDMSSIR